VLASVRTCSSRSWLRRWSAAIGLAALIAAAPAHAQAWLPWAAASDSTLPATLRASGGGYEAAWNALLVTELRSRLARADSARALFALALRVAAAEPRALGGRIAPDAMRLRTTWTREQWRARVRASVAESLATAAQSARDLARADSLFRSALAGYRALGEKRRTAWVLGSLGVLWFGAGEAARAESLYREALVARRAIGDPRMIGNTLNSLGTTNYLLGRYEAAVDFLRQARTVREQTGELGPLGATLNFLALSSVALGRTDSAEVWYRRSLELTTMAGDSARTIETLVNFGNLLAQFGRSEEALAFQERGLRAARERGDVLREGWLLYQAGGSLNQGGRFADAAARLHEAIAASSAAADGRSLPGEWLELGRSHLLAGDAAAARPALLRARAIADSLGNSGMRSAARINLAFAAEREHDLDEATRIGREALEIAVAAADSERTALACQTLGTVSFRRGDDAAALAWWTRALTAAGPAQPELAASLRLNLGNGAARLGRLDQADAHFAAAERTALEARLPEYAWRALLGYGDVAERRGDMGRALALNRRAATLIDTLRVRQNAEATSISLFGSRLFAYEALIHLLGKLDAAHPDSGYGAEAFQWAERARARALLDALAGGRSSAAGDRVTPVSLAEAQGLLPDDRTALLEYSLGDSSSSLWVVTRRRATRIALPPRAAIQSRAEVLRRSLGDAQRAESRSARTAARALHRMLVEPALAALGKAERLIVSPDGALALVPFEAFLAADAAEGKAAPKNAWLGERFPISYTSSATALALAGRAETAGRAAESAGRAAGSSGRAAEKSGRRIFALGDPRFGGGPPLLAPLPHTAAEVAALRQLSRGRDVVTVTGRDASRERLLALPRSGSLAVLHVATHGVADESEPARSGLWLAAPNDSAPPAFASLGDIAALSLAAELVTLSACETGVGRLERGEGVMGLTRAFLVAGARSVIVSLWPVNDRSTATLMETFYRQLLAKGRPRDEALAEARRALMKRDETRSPFYWAPFVLVGEAGALR
jgi:CHAT domain-containing protein